MKKFLFIAVIALSLMGCANKGQTVPVVDRPRIEDLIPRPPEAAMVPPREPSPLVRGDTNANNSAIMRQNNLDALRDRRNLETLQQYIKSLFSNKK